MFKIKTKQNIHQARAAVGFKMMPGKSGCQLAVLLGSAEFIYIIQTATHLERWAGRFRTIIRS